MISIRRISQLGYRVFREVWRFVSNEDARNGKYVRAFVSEMNETSRRLGAKDSLFVDPSGFCTKGSKSTAGDLLLLFSKALENGQIRDVLTTKEYTVKVDGIYKRAYRIKTTVKGEIIAGKTGTSPNNSYNLVFLASVGSGQKIICSILGSPSDECRWEDAYALAGYADKVLRGEEATVDVAAASYVIAEYPSGRIIAEKSADTEGVPASLIKIVTALTAVNLIDDWNQRVTIHHSDILKGSGNNVYVGFRVTVRDLFYDMLLPSSNTAATALARFLGRRIVKNR